MRFNANFHNGIKVLVDIAIYDKGNGVFQKDIATRNNISVKFLDHVMTALKAAGIIQRKRGYKNGYRLTTEPSGITLYQVYRAFEPDLFFYSCLTYNSECPQIDSCATHIFMETFNSDIKKILENKTIEDIKGIQDSLRYRNEFSG